MRRALLLFALVLGLTALAASIAPAPRTSKTDTTPTPAPNPASEPAAEAASGEVAVSFRAGGGGKPPERKVTPGTPLVVQITSATSGQAEIPRLGRVATVTESAPARFSLLAPPAGRYDVLFQPTTGEAERVGTLVSAG